MKKKMLDLYAKHGDILRYLIIGGLTTAIDILLFMLLNTVFGLHYQVAKILTWVIAVSFAFWGNKRIVFQTKTAAKSDLIREIASFFAMRLVTLGFSVLFMYVAVEHLHWDENISNIACTFIVIVLNYVLSKLIVFKKK